jgi:hypothetical protein
MAIEDCIASLDRVVANGLSGFKVKHEAKERELSSRREFDGYLPTSILLNVGCLILAHEPTRSYFGPIRAELRYIFVAPTFIDESYHTRLLEEPRCCYNPYDRTRPTNTIGN